MPITFFLLIRLTELIFMEMVDREELFLYNCIVIIIHCRGRGDKNAMGI